MLKDLKYIYKTSYRINGHIKAIISKAFQDCCNTTGMKLSAGRIERAFWLSLHENPVLRKKLLSNVCNNIVRDSVKRDKKSKIKDGKKVRYTKKDYR